MSHVYLNGQFVPRDQALISVDDRGFVFGDGVYEVTRASRGKLFAVERHVRRLERSLRALSIRVPADEMGRVEHMWHELLERNNLMSEDVLVYHQVTRGVAPRAHPFPPATVPPTVFASATAWTVPHTVRKRGARVITVADVRWSRCDIKSITLLPNAMAKQRAVEMDADEAIFVRDGVVLEGSASNLFALIDGELRTHPLTTYILGGITREIVLELAQVARVPVRETPILIDDLARATEVFYTGTSNDVMPVTMVDGRKVGDGQPGKVTMGLYDLLAKQVEA